MRIARSRLALTSLLIAAPAALLACGESVPEAPPDEPPIVGGAEVAISLHSRDAAPSGALHVEINMNELQLEHHSVYTLASGRVPEAEVTENGLRLLGERIAAAPARSAASLTIYGAVPYATTVRTLQTLLAANYRTFHFAVRAPNTTTFGWHTVESPRVVPATGAVTFPTVTRPWADFASHWQEVYEGCRAAGPARYIDCDGAPSATAEGGELVVELWARGSGLVVRFEQTNAPDAGPVSTGPAMLEGVRAPRGAEEEAPPPIPDAQAVFSFRFEEASDPESHIPAMARPVCASGVCPTVVEADGETQTMRILSLLGAVFPDGTTAPTIAFRLPE